MMGIAARLVLFVVGSGFAIGANAQETWIVDEANGPGAHFTDLPPAIAAAKRGDLVIVRGSNNPNHAYSAVTVREAISIVGEENRARCNGLTILDLPTEERVHVARLDFHGLDLRRNAGAILFESVGVFILSRVVVEDCAWLTFRGGGASVGSTSHAVRRSVVFLESTHWGERWAATAFTPTVVVEDSLLVVNASHLEGQNGNSGAACSGGIPGQPAVELWRSTLLATGGSRFTGGFTSGWPCGGCGASIRQANAENTVILDPSTQVTCPTTWLPPRIGIVPAVSSTTLFLAHAVEVRCNGPTGEAAVVVASRPPSRPLFLPEGVLGIDPTTMVIVGAGVIPASGSLQFSFGVTSAIAPGEAVAFQGVLGGRAGFHLTIPSFGLALW